MKSLSNIKQNLEPKEYLSHGLLSLIISRCEGMGLHEQNIVEAVHQFSKLAKQKNSHAAYDALNGFLDKLQGGMNNARSESKASQTSDYIQNQLDESLRTNKTQINHEPKSRLKNIIRKLFKNVSKCRAEITDNKTGKTTVMNSDSAEVKKELESLYHLDKLLEHEGLSLMESKASVEEKPSRLDLEIKCR